VPLSAVSSGVAEIKQAIARARAGPAARGRTMLFVDEIHRLNKLQQVPRPRQTRPIARQIARDVRP
jgi:replication-associated recombination protein RarA